MPTNPNGAYGTIDIVTPDGQHMEAFEDGPLISVSRTGGWQIMYRETGRLIGCPVSQAAWSRLWMRAMVELRINWDRWVEGRLTAADANRLRELVLSMNAGSAPPNAPPTRPKAARK